MDRLVYGAYKDYESGQIVLAYGGRNFLEGSFSQTAFTEILTGRLRSEKSKIKKAEEVFARLESEDYDY